MRSSRDWLAPFEPTRSQPWDRVRVAHLLRRAALATDLLEECLELGPRAAVERLVRGAPPDRSEKQVIAALEVAIAGDDPNDFAAWWLLRMLATRDPLRWRMTLFWHDHFATAVRKVRSTYWMAQQVLTFAEHGLGPYRELLRAVATGPAMLRWLDGDRNRRGRPNENFARELFELFTLGRNATTEADIQAAARALTGWVIVRDRGFFDPGRHDPSKIRLFGSEGRFDLDRVLEVTLAHEQAPRFLAGKLLRCLVGPRPPKAALDEVAALLEETDFRIDVALRRILASRGFHDPGTMRARIRGPVEWAVWLLRSLGCRAPAKRLVVELGHAGQKLLDPPDVGGWPEERAWWHEGAVLQRARIAARLGAPKGPLAVTPRLPDLVPRLPRGFEASWFRERLFPDGLPNGEEAALAAYQDRIASLERADRLAGLFTFCALLPSAQRF